jgi:hypothetical protein
MFIQFAVENARELRVITSVSESLESWVLRAQRIQKAGRHFQINALGLFPVLRGIILYLCRFVTEGCAIARRGPFCTFHYLTPLLRLRLGTLVPNQVA